jgi:RNA polymerase sigma-54 factor
MSVGLRLDLRQTQGLVMTPPLQQAIQLLQLPNVELADYVATELEQNPFLEPQEEPAEAPVNGLDREAEPPVDRERERVAESAAADDGWPEPAADAAADAQFAPSRGGGADLAGDGRPLEEMLTRGRTLHEHLIEQLHVEIADPRERLIGLHLVDLVDDAGYLRGDPLLVAERLDCPEEDVLRVLERLQRFEPTGVCARTVQECLALQLQERDRLDPAMQALLDHLDLVAAGDLAGIRRATGVDAEDLAEMLHELKSLDPKPGLAFGDEAGAAVVPDVLITAYGQGFRVELNSHTLPRVLVNAGYYAEVSRSAREPGARAFVAERFQTANWLVKALDQRARTLLRVGEAIVERQIGFLRHGVRQLRPLGLRDIAEATGMHESTVSRAVAEKWAATPRGTLPLKYFFTNAVGDGDGAHAAEAIRQQIRAMIEHESPKAVLSDDQIVERLRAGGVAIARRTVAKYRESLGIPSSVQRRRQKAFWLA